VGTVVGVEDYWDTVGRGDGADIMSGGDATLDGGVLVGVGDTLSGKVGSTTLRGLDNDWRFLITGSF